ncbi:18467_t:CDS:1, partial [Gigaspora rosea]
LGWNLKSAEGLGKGYEIWNKKTDKYKQEISKHKTESPKKEKYTILPTKKNPKMHALPIQMWMSRLKPVHLKVESPYLNQNLKVGK